MKLWMDMVTLSDAKKLRSWWNKYSASCAKFYIRKSTSNSRYWALYIDKRYPGEE
jgi:hypothetical protein